VDMSDPANVKEVSRWWVPGQRLGEEEEYKKYRFAGDHTSWTGNHGALTVPKRVEDGGTVGYGGFGAFGMYVMDLSDIKHPMRSGPSRSTRAIPSFLTRPTRGCRTFSSPCTRRSKRIAARCTTRPTSWT
jgi:hypothetical protein